MITGPWSNQGEMDNRSARIVALRRYVALLQLDESRLNWVIQSSLASEQDRTEAFASLQANADKIARANMELSQLETQE